MSKKTNSIMLTLLLVITLFFFANCSNVTQQISADKNSGNLKEATISPDHGLISVNFNTSKVLNLPDVNSLDIIVEGMNMSPTAPQNIEKLPNGTFPNLTVEAPEGKNKIITVIGKDALGNEIPCVVQYGYVDILSQTTTPVTVTWDTTPTGAILKALLNDSTTDISIIDSTALQVLVDNPAIENRLINIEANAEYYVDNGFFSSTPSLILHAPATISGILYAIDGTTPLKESYVVKICDRLSGAVLSLDDDTGYYSINNIVPGDHTISVYGDDGSVIGSKTITIPDGAVLNNIDIITTIEYTPSLGEIKISSAIAHQLILDETGTVWAGGSDFWGQLGGGYNTHSEIPLPFFELASDVKNVFAGGLHSIILKNDNTLWGMGTNWNDPLGLGDWSVNAYTSTLTKITDNVKYVSTDLDSSAIIKTDNTLWTNHGGYYFAHTHPTAEHGNLCKVMENVKDVAIGSFSYYILKDDNSLWVTGENAKGQLGLGDNTDRYDPVELTDDVKDMSAGTHHVLILKNNGTLWVTGMNEYGQLGLGDKNNRNKLVELTSDVKDMSAGLRNSLVLKNNGTLWATGANQSGQLGVGNDVPSGNENDCTETLVQIMIDDIKNIDAGISSFLILKNDDTIWGTGHVGDIETTIPVQITLP